jgi:hypothetical protein
MIDWDGPYAAWASDECRLEGWPGGLVGLDQLAATGRLDQYDLPGDRFVTELEHRLEGEDICR